MRPPLHHPAAEGQPIGDLASANERGLPLWEASDHTSFVGLERLNSRPLDPQSNHWRNRVSHGREFSQESAGALRRRYPVIP